MLYHANASEHNFLHMSPGLFNTTTFFCLTTWGIHVIFQNTPLNTIHRWWKHFSGFIDLSFIRDRLVESYTWAYVLYYEKGFELQRSITTKMIVLITTLDDTYDIRATIEECRKLHEAIQRFE